MILRGLVACVCVPTLLQRIPYLAGMELTIIISCFYYKYCRQESDLVVGMRLMDCQTVPYKKFNFCKEVELLSQIA
jgi:hypothetical protein